jgi:hypothetical protein
MKIVSLFLWLLVPLGAYGAYQTWDLPHGLWSYSFHANGAQYDLRVPRYYTSCTYLGWHGGVTRSAQNGKCPWVRFFKPKVD